MRTLRGRPCAVAWARALSMAVALITASAGAALAQDAEGEPPATDVAPDEDSGSPEAGAGAPPAPNEGGGGAEAPGGADAEDPPDGSESAPDPAGAEDPPDPAGAEDPPDPAGAEDPEDLARQQAEAGRAFYQAGNYVQAIGAFEAAFEITQSAALAYNIARCHERLSQWSDSVEWYERYVELETDPRERADALDKLALLRERAGSAGPEGVDQYEARMISGRRAYGRGDFEGAIEDFRAAFDVRAEADPIYNIAKSYEKMGRYDDALDNYGRYLELAPNAPDKADVEAIMERLRRDRKAQFQELAIASNPPGADVYLNDRNEGIIGQTNLRTKLRPGPHTLYIDLNGYEPVRRDIVMPDDKPLALEFDLTELENVGYVTFDVDQPGARIFIDGAIVGLSPFTQKKALEAGEHQIQVELVGFDRYARSFTVSRDAEIELDVDLDKYDPPVSDGTLSDWGRNLIVFGLIGGGLGFGGPIVYQEVVLDKPYFEQLGPESRTGQPSYYDGTAGTLRPNQELDDFETVQLVSLIAGGTLVVSGFVVYMYKWFRDTPPPPVTASTPPPLRRGLEITGFGVAPAQGGGGTVGITGRF